MIAGVVLDLVCALVALGLGLFVLYSALLGDGRRVAVGAVLFVVLVLVSLVWGRV